MDKLLYGGCQYIIIIKDKIVSNLVYKHYFS